MVGSRETVLSGFLTSGTGFGGGVSITGTFGTGFTSFFTGARGLAAGFGAGPAAGGPGNDTRLTFMAPGASLRLEPVSGAMTMAPIQIK